MTLDRIICGGQTGADRAGLDAALAAGLPVGGYCPKAREAEDGPIPDKYPLIEIKQGYRQRTIKNVEASDATLIFYAIMPVTGTALTLQCCLKQKKPFKLIDVELVSPGTAASAIDAFIRQNEVSCLNVAGPRESSCTGIYAYVFETIRLLLSRYNAQPTKSEHQDKQPGHAPLITHQPYEESP